MRYTGARNRLKQREADPKRRNANIFGCSAQPGATVREMISTSILFDCASEQAETARLPGRALMGLRTDV
jgi:hypothetical protein